MFAIGQRWYSQAEPELGLGIVTEVQDRMVSLEYPAAAEARIYNQKSAPLKRHALEVGEDAVSEDGESFLVEEVQEQNGILFYMGAEKVLPETRLKSDISLVRPEERLVSGNFDSNELYNFRYETVLLKRALQTYQARGLEGARINLIGHQVSIFDDISKKPRPRMILADEVGLGKTIEAGLAAKRLVETNQAKSILILAPATLQYQWFVELFKKFDLLFKTLGAGDEIELSDKLDNDDLIITSPRHVLESQQAFSLATEKEWDLLIVDEAHRYENESKEFELLEHLTQKARSAFYLSATPEALGEENFFELLRMLNPQKYRSFQDYLDSEKAYVEATHASAELLEKYRYERDLFRNRRKNLEQHNEPFPKKTLSPIRLEVDRPSDKKVAQAKAFELARLLKENPEKKFLAIGKSRKLAVQIQKELLELMQVKTALFHADQSLLERDRQAAYFADPEGARVLVSAESGSEGRNFEFASELFLLDFPIHPQLLLQRIGRLDRIGQKNTVTIHAPYVANTPEENIFLLHKDAFGLFENFPTGLIEFYEARREQIREAVETKQKDKLQKLSEEYKSFQKSVEESKNRFLDAHSFKQENVDRMNASIQSFHKSKSLQGYLEKAFNFAGVDIEEIADRTWFIRPSDNMAIPSYPNLPSEGFSYTDSRELAMKREDLRFMNFESPIVQGTMDLFTEGEFGNAAAASHQGKLGDNLYIEFIFKVEPKKVYQSEASRFFPITPARVLLDASGEDQTAKYPKKFIDEIAQALSGEQSSKLSQGLPKQAVDALVSKALGLAGKRAAKYKEKALKEISGFYETEIKKLREWGANNDYAELEIKKLEDLKAATLEQTSKLAVELDALRILI